MMQHTSGDVEQPKRSWPLSRWIFLGFAIIAGYYLVTEHAVHVSYFLPFAFLLACPLMHLFMHHGDNHGASGGGKSA